MGGAQTELAQDLTGRSAGTGHPSPVLCFASALAQYKAYKGDKMEVISPKGSYKDRCTKKSVSI